MPAGVVGLDEDAELDVDAFAPRTAPLLTTVLAGHVNDPATTLLVALCAAETVPREGNGCDGGANVPGDVEAVADGGGDVEVDEQAEGF